jgi:hypothetical protein
MFSNPLSYDCPSLPSKISGPYWINQHLAKSPF